MMEDRKKRLGLNEPAFIDTDGPQHSNRKLFFFII